MPPLDPASASATLRTTTGHNLLAEGLIDLNEAAAIFQDGRGRKPHIATLRRWAKNGCRGVKLETTFLGNRMMTSRPAAERFLAGINGQPTPVEASNSAAVRAGELLAKAGI
jgi:hypothetical protein